MQGAVESVVDVEKQATAITAEFRYKSSAACIDWPFVDTTCFTRIFEVDITVQRNKKSRVVGQGDWQGSWHSDLSTFVDENSAIVLFG